MSPEIVRALPSQGLPTKHVCAVLESLRYAHTFQARLDHFNLLFLFCFSLKF